MKYPRTLASVARSTVTMAANTRMQPLDQTDYQNGKSPMTAYKPWSSLTIEFADSEKKIGGSGSIEIEKMADVIVRTKIAMEYVMKAELEGGGTAGAGDVSDSTLLDTKVFFLPLDMKDHKGKTAFDIASVCGPDKANSAAANIESHIDPNNKYAANNKKQADALRASAIIVSAKNTMVNGKSIASIFAEDMNQAVQVGQQLYAQQNPAANVAGALYQLLSTHPEYKSKLNDTAKSNTVKSGELMIYGPYTKTPNTKKVDANGMTKVYTLKITCNPARTKSPFHVELDVGMGRPDTSKQVGILPNTAVYSGHFKMDMTTWEWLNIIDRADWEKKLIALYNHEVAYKAMEDADKQNIAQSKNSQQYTQTQNTSPMYTPNQAQNFAPYNPGYYRN